MREGRGGKDYRREVREERSREEKVINSMRDEERDQTQNKL